MSRCGIAFQYIVLLPQKGQNAHFSYFQFFLWKDELTKQNIQCEELTAYTVRCTRF